MHKKGRNVFAKPVCDCVLFGLVLCCLPVDASRHRKDMRKLRAKTQIRPRGYELSI